MRLSVTDVIRRGFNNTVANWPVLLIKVAEGVLMIIIAVAAVIAAIVPVIVSLGLNTINVDDPDQFAEFILDTLASRWTVILYVFAVATILLIIFVAVHSFVEAGAAHVYLDAERTAGAAADPPRPQFRVFTAERWFSGAKRDWWPVFWIYNIAWGVAGLIILAPLLVVGALMLLLHESPGAMLAVTCLGLMFSLFILVIVMIVTNIWCQKAIVVCAARLHRAPASLGEAWREFLADPGRHIAITLILIVLTLAGSALFASISFVGGMSDSPGFVVAMLPIQMIGSFANTVFSTMMAAWFLACFATLSVEPR